MLESEACRRFPDLVVTSSGGLGKDKPDDSAVTCSVLLDGTHGISVKTEDTHSRSGAGAWLPEERPFALTADVSEDHWQVPIDDRDCHRLGCQVQPRAGV